jgi:DnaK suppressor protein
MTVDMEQFRVALLEERGRVEKAIRHLRDDHSSRIDDEVEETAGSDSSHLAAIAAVTLDREIDYTLEENSTQVLGDIDAALLRIDAGTYGRCTNCGEEIPSARLEAYPWASLCIDCKRKTERG